MTVSLARSLKSISTSIRGGGPQYTVYESQRYVTAQLIFQAPLQDRKEFNVPWPGPRTTHSSSSQRAQFRLSNFTTQLQSALQVLTHWHVEEELEVLRVVDWVRYRATNN